MPGRTPSHLVRLHECISQHWPSSSVDSVSCIGSVSSDRERRGREGGGREGGRGGEGGREGGREGGGEGGTPREGWMDGRSCNSSVCSEGWGSARQSNWTPGALRSGRRGMARACGHGCESSGSHRSHRLGRGVEVEWGPHGRMGAPGVSLSNKLPTRDPLVCGSGPALSYAGGTWRTGPGRGRRRDAPADHDEDLTIIPRDRIIPQQ